MCFLIFWLFSTAHAISIVHIFRVLRLMASAISVNHICVVYIFSLANSKRFALDVQFSRCQRCSRKIMHFDHCYPLSATDLIALCGKYNFGFCVCTQRRVGNICIISDFLLSLSDHVERSFVSNRWYHRYSKIDKRKNCWKTSIESFGCVFLLKCVVLPGWKRKRLAPRTWVCVDTFC